MKMQALPRSSKILLSLLFAVSSLIFFIKLSFYKESGTGTSGNEQVNFHDIQVPYLQLIPRFTIYRPWVLITSIFAEISLFSFLVSAFVLALATKYVERFWGYKEVIKFVLIVGTCTNLFTVLFTIVSNLMRSDILGMNKPLGGGISYYFGFLVVLKQLIPEHNIILFKGLINFRVKHLPFILLCAVTCWSVLLSRSLYPAVPSLGSFFISYIYLRFFQRYMSDPLLPVSMTGNELDAATFLRGDASDAFKLSEFFPNVFKPYLSVLFDVIYDIGIFFGLITPFNDDSIQQSNIRAQKRLEHISQAHRIVANSVAERRRQVALQVIEDRINKENSNGV